LYEHAFAVPNSGEHSGFILSREIIITNFLKDSFIGVLAINPEEEVIGLAYGFQPRDDAHRSQIIAKRIGAEWLEKVFMIDAFGMHFQQHSPELAIALHDALVERVKTQGYQRLRTRIYIPRLDNLHGILAEQGWETFDALSGLSHVMWMGKTL
jgi:hypothetical protein